MKAEKAQWKERQHRALISARFAALVADTGLGIEGVGKLLHVTTRTVRNWISGQTNIPYSAYKLLRLLRFMELPGGFEGWCMHSGRLWTPERHPIEPVDGGWWSLLVRQARSFRVLYQQQTAQRIADRATALANADGGVPVCGGLAVRDGAAVAGLVSYKTSLQTGDSEPTKTSHYSQNDVTITSWPILYDYPPSLTSPPEPELITSGSALMHSSVLPWTPIYGVKLAPLSRLPTHRVGSKGHLKQALTVSASSAKKPKAVPKARHPKRTPSDLATVKSSPVPRKKSATISESTFLGAHDAVELGGAVAQAQGLQVSESLRGGAV